MATLKTTTIVILTCIISTLLSAQTDTLEQNDNQGEILTIVETMPTFPGGETALKDFLSKNIKYPTLAKETNISGKVYASFVVDTMGNISKIKIIRGIGSGCDEEVIRVLKLMPKWKPGTQNGKPVNVGYTLPVSFQLK